MNAKNILFATDFSPASETALELASTLAAESGATLHIAFADVAVAYPVGGGVYGVAFDGSANERERHAQQEKLDGVSPTRDSVACVHHYLEGVPAEEIVALAAKEGVDLIVVGSHGRTGLSRMLLGSVAEAIVRHAECPVVVVKHAAKLATQIDSEIE